MRKILIQIHFSNHFFVFRFAISHMAIELTFTTDSVSEFCPVCHSVAM